MLQPHILAPQSTPCVYLGRARNQPGHMSLDPLNKRIYVSPQARFVDTCSFPGLEAPAPPLMPPTLPFAAPPAPPDVLGDDAAQHDDEEDTHMRTSTTNTDADEGTVADRLLRCKKARAAVVAPDLCQCPTAPFVTYLCSGAARNGDLAAHLTAGGLMVVHVDYERGRIGHDPARDDVAIQVSSLAASSLCVAVVDFASQSWTLLQHARPGPPRFKPGTPQVLRTDKHPLGIPQSD
eukprot:2621769-Pleurochrysis_carterae.AAC.3